MVYTGRDLHKRWIKDEGFSKQGNSSSTSSEKMSAIKTVRVFRNYVGDTKLEL